MRDAGHFDMEPYFFVTDTGRPSDEKIKSLREQIEKKKAWGFAVTALDEIAWLFNLRGSDIAYNPVSFAYALVTRDDVTLYIDDQKISPEVADYSCSLGGSNLNGPRR